MLSYGICGGGLGSLIGDVHIRGIEATHGAQLVAGCFSRNYENNITTGKARNIATDRIYSDYREMAQKESEREDGIDFVVIATPNFSHYEIAKAFLNAGIHVSCDKPVTTEEWQAKELQVLSAEKGLKFLVTFTYVGLPAVMHAREIIRRGDLGDIVMIMGEYIADYMVIEGEQKPWRMNPSESGKMNVTADIGSHILFLADYLTGMEIKEVCCEMDRIGCELDTNSSVIAKYMNGASGVYWMSGIAHGHDNGIGMRIYGTKGALEWKNEEPEIFTLTFKNEPPMRISKGKHYRHSSSIYSYDGRLPAGHHEGFYYSFTNLYEPFIKAINGHEQAYFPNIKDAVNVMHILEACYQSSMSRTWIKTRHE